MTWRSVVISTPARLKYQSRALVVQQDCGDTCVPLEDIAVLVIDSPQVMLTSQLLAACANQQIAVITVDETHTPNGVLLAYLPHSRALQVMRKQLAMSQPQKKRLWQGIIQQKLYNQAIVLQRYRNAKVASYLQQLAQEVRSGDPDNLEGQGAQFYFRNLFPNSFHRAQNRFYNAALNYGYSVIRSAIARSLVSYGFLPAFGLHHRNERNAFNLADDLIEPYRPLLDQYILDCYPLEPERNLEPSDKGGLVRILHHDIQRLEQGETIGSSTLLALIEATVISLAQRADDGLFYLTLPGSVAL